MNHKPAGLQEREDHWRASGSAAAPLPELGLGRFSDVKTLQSCQASRLRFAIAYMTNPSAFLMSSPGAASIPSAASMSSLLAKTFALGLRQGAKL